MKKDAKFNYDQWEGFDSWGEESELNQSGGKLSGNLKSVAKNEMAHIGEVVDENTKIRG